MKIAVLFYGRINKSQECYESLKNALGNTHNFDFYLSSDNPSEEDLETFKKLYNPIAYDVSSKTGTIDESKYPKRPETIVSRMIPHFINKQTVFSLLKEKQIEYDLVLVTRIDLIFSNCFDFSNIVDNIIYIPCGNDFVVNGVNDQLAYGKYDVIEKYCSLYSNMLTLLDNKLSILHPEPLNFANIKYSGLYLARVPLLYVIRR